MRGEGRLERREVSWLVEGRKVCAMLAGWFGCEVYISGSGEQWRGKMEPSSSSMGATGFKR